MKSYLFDGISIKNKRSENMDSLLLKSVKIGGYCGLLAVVCDGVGSMADGAFASANVVRMLDEWFGALVDVNRIGIRLRDNIIKINAHISSAAKVNKLDCATTLSALMLIGNAYYIVHAGDSRIYSFRDGSFEALTVDDVSESGKLTACIGRYGDVKTHYAEGAVDGGLFLLCTDGMYKRMDFNFLRSQMRFNNKRELRKALKAITDYAVSRGESDNISVAMVKTES